MSDGEYWFFTMELVRGVNFLQYVRPGYNPNRSHFSMTPTLIQSVSGGQQEFEPMVDYEAVTQHLDPSTNSNEEISSQQADLSRTSTLDLERLNAALRQLAEGLHGLHETGKLHRDIKPSNVLVSKEGRVVILDFGLVTEVEDSELPESVNLAGTPDYMSPEQGAQLPVSPASDRYSVGVMLYQALTGRLPFTGKFYEVMINKQSGDPPAPAEVVRGLPQDLNDLCVGLLRRDPGASNRPRGLAYPWNGETGPLSLPLTPEPISSPLETAPFIGREKHLEELTDAFNATRKGQTTTVYVHGSSGMGKTSLVRHFLDALHEREPNVVILEGRCYERESVPYKALDGVVDSLTRYLLDLPEGEADGLVPRDIPALARLFPVMLQIYSVFSAPQSDQEIPDPFALRRRAFAALRDLLQRISKRQPLVLYIDDLQWSDADSTSLLEDLLRPPDAPPLLLLASFRSEEIETKPFLRSLLANTGSDDCRELRVTALTKDEARELASGLLVSVPADESVIESIVKEAHGNAFLVEQLARYAATSDNTATTGISLGVMLISRLRQLPPGTEQFVNTLAVAGRPISQEVAYQAAGLSGDELPLVSSLRAAQFLRGGGSERTVELYHDRIRRTSPPSWIREALSRFTSGSPMRWRSAELTTLKRSSNTTWVLVSE